MRIWTLMRYFELCESCKSIGIISALKKLIVRERQVILAVKNIETLKPIEKKSYKKLRFIEIKQENYDYFNLIFPVKSRKYRMQKYLKNGFKAFIVVCGNEVAGDVWYTSGADASNKNLSDLKWLGIQMTKNEAYMFDMFVNPDKRHHHINDFLVNRSLIELKQKGNKKIYGYYDSDNVAALWFHRMHNYTELKKITTKQTFLRRVIGAIPKTDIDK